MWYSSFDITAETHRHITSDAHRQIGHICPDQRMQPLRQTLAICMSEPVRRTRPTWFSH